MNKKHYSLKNEKISKLILKFSAPAALGMIAISLYNLADTFFVGRVIGVTAIAALSTTFPINIAIMAFAQMSGIGGASIVSRNFGANNPEKTASATGNVFLLSFLISLILALLLLSFLTPILSLLGTTKTTIDFAKTYLSITIPGSIFFSMLICGNNIIRAEGNAKFAMFTMIFTSFLNIILDAVFVMLLNWGIKGAAFATVISQLTTLLIVLFYLFSKKSAIKLKIHHFIPKIKLQKEILSIGFPSFARQITGSIGILFLNRLILTYGNEISLAAFWIMNRISTFLFMPIFGIVQGIQPILGFNYGAKQYKRVKQTFFIASNIVTTILILGTIIILTYPEQLIKLFNKNQDLIKIGAHSFRIMASLLPIIGYQIICSAMFQALGKSKEALLLGMMRDVIFFFPFLFTLPYFLGLNGIWITFPISDILAAIASIFFIKTEIKVLNKLDYEQTLNP